MPRGPDGDPIILGLSLIERAALAARRAGLGLGTGGVSLILATLVFLLVRRLATTKMDVRADDRDPDDDDGSGADQFGRGRALGLDLG